MSMISGGGLYLTLSMGLRRDFKECIRLREEQLGLVIRVGGEVHARVDWLISSIILIS